MGKDLSHLFFFRSKREEKKAMEEYAAWAFPYGAVQKEKIRELLSRLIPKEDVSIAIVIFLTGKEAFCDKDGQWDAEEARNPLEEAEKALRRSGMRIPKRHVPLYLALILADSQVDEQLLYPEVEELLAMADRLS